MVGSALRAGAAPRVFASVAQKLSLIQFGYMGEHTTNSRLWLREKRTEPWFNQTKVILNLYTALLNTYHMQNHLEKQLTFLSMIFKCHPFLPEVHLLHYHFLPVSNFSHSPWQTE